MGYLELLKGTANENHHAEAISYVEKAQQGANSLNAMITSLLDVKRLEAGEMPLSCLECDLRDVARAAVTPIAALVGENRLVLEEPPASVQAMCDEGIVRRVIANLVNNALKFAPNGSQVRVKIVKDGEYTRLSVSDRGPGIPPEYQTNIFEKFAQVAGREIEHSTGLGLTFCKLAIETHGGSIGVKSEVGLGSIFWFSLPGPSTNGKLSMGRSTGGNHNRWTPTI